LVFCRIRETGKFFNFLFSSEKGKEMLLLIAGGRLREMGLRTWMGFRGLILDLFFLDPSLLKPNIKLCSSCNLRLLMFRIKKPNIEVGFQINF
jgi:hypothetical protein